MSLVKNPNDILLELYQHWEKDPVLGIRSLFKVDPTQQQIELIQSAWPQQSRTAASSCQGSGKTATLTWLTFLFLLVKADCRILITSPSYQQLTRVFSAEASKWLSKMEPPFNTFFNITKEKIALRGAEGHQFAQLVTASAENSESLQGGHSDNYIVLGDEASGIPEDVFDLLLGTLSTGDGGRMLLTSNPLRSSGRFYEIFSRDLAKWNKLFFSAYDSPNINKEWIEEMKETYGEDSDIFRVRVLGRFPRASNSQYIPTNIVEEAMQRSVHQQHYGNYPKVIGVDVARFGDDSTVFVVRQGPKLLDITVFNGLDNTEVADKLFEYQRIHNAATIFIDGIGVGGGVVDICKRMGLPIKEVIVSMNSSQPLQYANLRSQCWGLMKTWLDNGADIPNLPELKSQLTSMQYGYNGKMQIQLMTKRDIKRMGLPSPDIPDAVSYTFAGESFTIGSVRTTARKIARPRYLWI